MPDRQCYEWHWRPALDQPKKKEPPAIGDNSFAPCHDDRKRSLSTGIDDGRKKYNCFACKDPHKTRAALLKKGIPPECIALPRAARAEITDQVADILTSDLGNAAKVLACGVLVIEGGAMPKGEMFVKFAARLGLRRSHAYDAKHALQGRRPK